MKQAKNCIEHSVDGRAIQVRHLDQFALARRWTLSQRTLERWRWRKIGPRYIKLGGHVAYRLEDIEDFERAQLRG
jgi:hypothetical protein